MINRDTHARFWVTLERNDYDELLRTAQELNLSLSSYAGQILAENLKAKHTDIDAGVEKKTVRTPETLNKMILSSLEKQCAMVPFVVKDLFDATDWNCMSRSQKATAAKILANVERSSGDLHIVGYMNKAALYQKEVE